MIRRTRRRGDRREYFSAPPEALDNFLASAGRIYRQFREMAERGLRAIEHRPPESRRRLEEVRDLFAFVEVEVPRVAERVPPRPCRHEPAGRNQQHDRSHPDRAAHQVLRVAPRASSTSTSRSTRARRSASSARTAPARRRRSARCSTTSGRPAAGRTIFGIETTVDPVAIHRRIGYLPGEFALYDKLTGGQTIEYFANLRGGVDRRTSRALIARLDLDPTPQVQGVLEGQQAEDRARSSRSSTGRTC